MHENSISTGWEILSRSCYYHGAPTILTIIINVTVFVKLKKLLNHRTADLFTFDVFLGIFFSASCGIPFQVLPDYQEGAEQVRNWNKIYLKSIVTAKKKKQTKKATHTSIKKGLLRGLLLVSEVIICFEHDSELC